MSKVKFKVGDLVYCPSISSEILNIKVLPIDVMVFDITHSISRNDCGFVSYLNNAAIVRLDNGCCTKTHFQKIVHATTENHRLLSKLYPNVAFEPPPKRKEPREIIEAMLDNNYPFVLSSKENYALFLCNETNINEFNLDDYFIVSKETGQFIIDFVDGEVVLED